MHLVSAGTGYLKIRPQMNSYQVKSEGYIDERRGGAVASKGNVTGLG